MKFAPAGGPGVMMPPAGGQGAGQPKYVYGLKDIIHIPNYSFLAPIEAEFGIWPSWGTLGQTEVRDAIMFYWYTRYLPRVCKNYQKIFEKKLLPTFHPHPTSDIKNLIIPPKY